MTRAMHLINAFLAGCIASSFLGWIAMLNPIAFRIISALLCTAVIVWGLAWILDDTLTAWLKISPLNWQAILLSSLAMLLIGLGVVLCS